MQRLSRYAILCFTFLLSSYLLFYGYAFLHRLDLTSMFRRLYLYDRNGNLIYESDFQNQNSYIHYQELPNDLKNAIISVEDQHFFQHAGIDYLRTSKALFHNLTHNTTQGGSTITQQLAKNLFLNNEQTFIRKIKELLLACRIEMQYSKENILEAYVNCAYYGHGITGIKSAAQFYYGCDVQDLTLAQCATLAAIPNGPSIYSPLLKPDNAITRRNLILSLMKNRSCISEQQYEQAIQESLNLHANTLTQAHNINPYYLDAVLNEIALSDYANENVLHVYTGYDAKVQEAIDYAYATHSHPDGIQSAMIISEPFSGNVLAIQGGSLYEQSSFNRALYAKRQIASTIKPLLYISALELGFQPDTTFVSQQSNFKINDQIYAPTNYNGSYPNSEISMINAIALSDNIYAMKTSLAIGSDELVKQLQRFDFSDIDNHPSLPLGTVDLSLFELSNIYLTLASEGLKVEPRLIVRVQNEEEVLYEHKQSLTQHFSRDETLMMNQMLRSVFDIKNQSHTLPSMIGYEPQFTMGVKSGTSDFDSLVMGIHPYYVIGVWVGFDDHRPLDKNYYPLSKQLFKTTMDTLYDDDLDTWYVPSQTLEVKKVNPISAKPQKDGSEYWFKK